MERKLTFFALILIGSFMATASLILFVLSYTNLEKKIGLYQDNNIQHLELLNLPTDERQIIEEIIAQNHKVFGLGLRMFRGLLGLTFIGGSFGLYATWLLHKTSQTP